MYICLKGKSFESNLVDFNLQNMTSGGKKFNYFPRN